MGTSSSKNTDLENKITTLQNQLSNCENEKKVLHTNVTTLSSSINPSHNSEAQKIDHIQHSVHHHHTVEHVSQNKLQNIQNSPENGTFATSQNTQHHSQNTQHHIPEHIAPNIKQHNTDIKNTIHSSPEHTSCKIPQKTNDIYDILTTLTDDATSSMYSPKLGPVKSYNNDPTHKIKLDVTKQNTLTPIKDTSNYVKSKQSEPNAEVTCNLKCRADPNCELFVHNKKTNTCWYKFRS